ncbi:MAG: STN domain-containing protein [Pirellulaceae bacterium]
METRQRWQPNGPLTGLPGGSCGVVVSILLFTLVAPNFAQETTASNWLTGANFERQLGEPVDSIVWTSGELRQKLQNLSRTVRVAIWLDRRLDPSQPMALELTATPLRECLEQVAAKLGADVGTCGSVVYLGPSATARQLASLAAVRQEECQRLPAAGRSRTTGSQAWSWNILAEPRQLLEQLAAEADLPIDDPQRIPHDLWAAAELPPLTWAERMTLLLAGFDLTFTIEPATSQIRLVPIPARVDVVRVYPWTSASSTSLAELQQAAPAAQFQREGNRIRVSGRAEDHSALASLLDRVRPAADVPRGKIKVPGKPMQVYTMQGVAPLGNILKTLQVRAMLDITIDPRIQQDLYQRISFDVRDASLDDLLAAVFRDTGLHYELSGRQLRVAPGAGAKAKP